MNIHPIPEIPMIGQVAEKLYALEHVRSEAIKAAAKEQAIVMQHEDGEFWTRTMPEALASMLESYERAASIAAALGYLRRYGSVTFAPLGTKPITINHKPR